MIVTKKQKGISTFIATLLLMVLAISAGVVIYAYTMGYLGSFGGGQTMGAISIDAWSLDPTADTNSTALTAYIRNIGKTAFQANTVYVNGVQIDADFWAFNDDDPLIENKVGTLTIEMGAKTDGTDGYKFAGSITYDIKFIGVDNTQLSFQVKK